MQRDAAGAIANIAIGRGNKKIVEAEVDSISRTCWLKNKMSSAKFLELYLLLQVIQNQEVIVV